MDPVLKRVDSELVLRAAAAFRHLPGVHSVGIGGREREQHPTGETVLKVFVSQKLARQALRPEQRVPTHFEGVPTDVVEAPSPKNAAVEPGAPLGGPYREDKGRYRPLRGGVQLSGEHCYGQGTLGFLVRVDEPSPMRVCALTTHHALFSSAQAETPDLRVGQPTGDDSSTKCCRGIFGRYIKGYRDATMDAALVRVEAKTEYYAEIEGIGVIDGDDVVTLAQASTLTFRVRKRGRTSGLTGGTIQSVGTTHVSGSPQNYMVIKPNAVNGGGNATFADYGDSGAAIVNDDNRIVGMLFGLGSATAGQPQAGWGFAWSIADIKTRFAADGFDLIIEADTVPEHKKVVEVRPDDLQSLELEHRATGESARLASKVEQDLASSELGRLLTALWMRHSHDLNRMVNHNRRVAVGWQRTGGSALFQCAVRMANEPAWTVPEQIAGRPSDECLQDVLDLFATHGGPELRDDLSACRARLPQVAGRSYGQLIAGLHAGAGEDASWRS